MACILQNTVLPLTNISYENQFSREQWTQHDFCERIIDALLKKVLTRIVFFN